MTDLLSILASTGQAAAEGGGLLDSLKSLDPQSLGSGGSAIALGVIWYFFRIIRTIATVLITLCIIYLVLRLTGNIDMNALLPGLQALLGGGAAAS